MVQKILSVLKEAEDPDVNDYFENFMKDLPVHYDPDTDEALKEFEDEDLRLDLNSDDEDSENDLFANPECGEEEITENLSSLKKVHILTFFFLYVCLKYEFNSCEPSSQKLAHLRSGVISFETLLQNPTRTRRYLGQNLVLQTLWSSVM